MAVVNNSISRTYHRLFVELADPRTNDWFLITSPIPGLTILGLYLYFTLKWGPRYMADKKPFQLQKTLVVYNFVQVLVSIWLFYETSKQERMCNCAKMRSSAPYCFTTHQGCGYVIPMDKWKNDNFFATPLYTSVKGYNAIFAYLSALIKTDLLVFGLDAGWLRTYSWKCQPVDFSRSPEAMRVARGVYIYFLAKMSELLDTVFFVIRKKERQITFLHMYHHTVMPMISWGATKYYPGGHGTLIGVINSFVHIIMYTYYMMAAMGPQYQRFLFWKRHITTLQMLQFCIAFLHSSQLLIYDCGYPRWSVVFTLPNSIFFYYLFYDFYYKAYGKPNKKAANGSVKTDNKVNVNGTANGHTADVTHLNGKTNGVHNEPTSETHKKID